MATEPIPPGAVLEVVAPFFAVVDGVELLVPAGTTARAGHPIIEGHEDCFTTRTLDYEVAAPKAAPHKATAAKRR